MNLINNDVVYSDDVYSDDVYSDDINDINDIYNEKIKNINDTFLMSLEKYKNEYNRVGLEAFTVKDIKNFKNYDIIIFSAEKGVPTHAALFIGDDLILHQRYESISLIESIRKGHLKQISYILRHKKYA